MKLATLVASLTALAAVFLIACGGGDEQPACKVEGKEMPAEACR